MAAGGPAGAASTIALQAGLVESNCASEVPDIVKPSETMRSLTENLLKKKTVNMTSSRNMKTKQQKVPVKLFWDTELCVGEGLFHIHLKRDHFFVKKNPDDFLEGWQAQLLPRKRDGAWWMLDIHTNQSTAVMQYILDKEFLVDDPKRSLATGC
jgi:hypothetical protein